MRFDRNRLSQFPEKPGVYLMKNQEGVILYVGKAKDLKTRVSQYFKPGRDARAMIPILIQQIETIETILTSDEKEALLLENTLIKKHQPKYNVLLKDDKTFLSLMINTDHTWPMIKLVRHKENQKGNGLYFGPYTNALSAKTTFDLVSRTFPLRECSDQEMRKRTRPCILYAMKRCLAPCVNKCTKADYQEVVGEVVSFLQGKNKEVLKKLKEKMRRASDNLAFEEAGVILRTIEQITSVTQNNQESLKADIQDCDVFNYLREGNFILFCKLLFRGGQLIGSDHFDFSLVPGPVEELFPSFLLQHYAKESPPPEILFPHPFPDSPFIEEILDIKCNTEGSLKEKPLLDLALENAKVLFTQLKFHALPEEEMLLNLQHLLHLNRIPIRIECFDTSNLSGTDAVASLVAFTGGFADKSRYRTYKIDRLSFVDDYSALTEILTRRLSKAKEADDLPDLLIIDGGKGQLGIALGVLEALNIISVDVISLGKEEARHDKGLTEEKIFLPHKSDPIILDRHSPLLFFLQKIRDEAHRRAITSHRKKLHTRTLKSALDEVRGIGPVKKKALLQAFGSVQRIKEASDEELLKVISHKDIASLRDTLGNPIEE